jgi:DNA-binding PadR family transcriptional regulator
MRFHEEFFAGGGRRGMRGRGPGGWGRGGAAGGGEGEGPGGPPWRGRGWRALWEDRPPRADRGVVRFLVLDALVETARHGYEIMASIESKSGGAYRPSPGVVYPTLQLLEELGHVRVTVREDKKVYALTAAGTRELEEHREDVAAFYEQSEGVWEDRADELAELGHGVRRMIRTFRRFARRGRLNPSTMTKARAILDEAIQKLEALLDDR